MQEISKISKYSLSQISQLYHYLAYLARNSKMQLKQGMLIISIDIDAGNKELGIMNGGKNDRNVNKTMSEYLVGEIEELAFPLFLELFNTQDIPVTFAVRGQIVESNTSMLELILDSSVKHDIGAHGYYHRNFTNLSNDEAIKELRLISTGMRNFGIMPKSFVFPVNGVAYLNLLEQYGYKCYRSQGNFEKDCMLIERRGQLYNIHPSMFIDNNFNPVFIKEFLDISIRRRLPFHIWFHLWDFGHTKIAIQKSLKQKFHPFLTYAKQKEELGILSIETMLSAATKIEKIDHKRNESSF